MTAPFFCIWQISDSEWQDFERRGADIIVLLQQKFKSCSQGVCPRVRFKPEYGSSKHIQVKVVDGEIAITNLHVGSLGDILAYPIDVDPDLNISKIQLMDAILKELSADGFTESEASDFWSDFDNLQKAKIIR